MRYAKYKPTGIAWLPEVPEEWEMVRLKNVLRERVEKSSTGLEEPLSMSQKRGIVPTREMDVVPNAASSYVGAKKVYVDDIVFNKLKAHLGVFAISAYDGLVSPDYAVYTSSGLISRKYLEYLFHTPLYITEFRRKSTGIAIGLTRLYTKDLYSIYGVCPPMGVQRAIVSFLDEKCGLVDRLVVAKEKEVALLKELKQSMIAEAVTRGVPAAANAENAKGAKTRKDSLRSSANSAFFASAPAGSSQNPVNPVNPVKENRRLVPSGIPWLPEVPEGWEVKKMKYLFTERSDKGHPEEVPLCSTQAHGVIPQSLYENRVVVVNKDGLGQLKLVKVGDFVISLRSFQGGIEIAHYQGIISAAYTILEPRDSRNSPYFRYLFKSHVFIQLLQTCVTGIREGQNINYPLLSRKFIPVPPLAEQREIVSHIEARAAKIDAAVSGLEKEIFALKEYKQRLIADVVTGQRKVA